MIILKKLFEKQLYRFLIVGVSNVIISLTSFFILIDIGLYYVTASIIAHILGTINSFFWNKTWTFKSTNGNTVKESIKFTSVYLITYGINLLLLIFFVEILIIPPKPAAVIALPIIAIINFYGHKHFSFKEKS